jgi:uncharacterized protein (TIRG00374 family)
VSRHRARGGRLLLAAVSIAVLVASVLVAVRGVHPDDVAHALSRSQYGWLVPALVALAVGIVMRAVRWRALFPPSTRPAGRDVMRATLLGYFFNSILPARAGEAARVVALHQSGRTSRAEAVGTIAVERAIDVAALLAMFFAVSPWLPRTGWSGRAAVVSAVLLVGLSATIAALAVFGDRPVRALFRFFGRGKHSSVDRLEVMGENLVRGFYVLRDVRGAAIAVGWTLASWLMLALSAWFVTLAFGFGLSPAAGALITVAVGIAMILPSPPAAAGPFEAAALLSLKAYGVHAAAALSYALVLHGLNLFPFLLAGAWALHSQRRTVRTGSSSASSERVVERDRRGATAPVMGNRASARRSEPDRALPAPVAEGHELGRPH